MTRIIVVSDTHRDYKSRAVSYTHLDVYKRQMGNRTIGDKEVVKPLKKVMRIATPVSSTHLDVYKRQV